MSTHSRINQDLLKQREQANLGPNGLKIQRVFTADSPEDPYADINFVERSSRIINPDGSKVFEMNDVEVPDFWSQVATDILAQKYIRKRGVPQFDQNGEALLDQDGNQVLGSETSAKQAVGRLAETWRWWGETYGYFNRPSDAQAFEDELKYMLMHQMVAPNSPQWFNTGLAHKYNITGSEQGHWYVDPETGESRLSEDAYSHPQVHACFIQGLEDDLVSEGGIMDLVVREARVFKYGSGTGTNFSSLRGSGERLSGGGTSSGMMSFLNIFDAAAGSIKSGGTTRRAAKMVCVDIDHPEIEKFIEWKAIEEQKVASLVAGSYVNYRHLKQIMESAEKNGIDPEKNKDLKRMIKEAKDNYVPLNYVKRALMLIENGVKADTFDFKTYDTDFRSEAYSTVGGQNANNSVRVTNEFLQAVEEDQQWNLVNRTNGEVSKTMSARSLWEKIANSAWQSADPGLQYHTTINEWHTCLSDGEIRASNPCSEYMFLDDTACNLASFNLVKFYNHETKEFKVEEYKHAIRIMTIVLEISVLMAQLPSRIIAERTYNYRTLGLGYANLGALMMMKGIPYESEAGYGLTGALTAILTGEAYATSAEMAKAVGAFNRYEDNQHDMSRVIRNHRLASYNAQPAEYEGLSITPMGINPAHTDADLLAVAQESWDAALGLGEKYGYRNAQATCIAPTGTIGLIMDCDTTGIEPDFALVKFKKLVGGGYFKLVNQSVEPALENLGYSASQRSEIIQYIVGRQSLDGSAQINRQSLTALGFTQKEFAAIEAALPGMFELKYAFSKWVLGEEFCKNVLRMSEEELNDANLNILSKLGFSAEQIQQAEDDICGRMTIEGAPHLKSADYAVFDCANKCGKYGKRFIAPVGHIKQMAAAQPFISGAISKTINFPEEATVAEVADAYLQSWKLMLKANALYRDGSKLSQPLSTSSADDAYAKLFAFTDDEVVDETVSSQVLHQATIAHQDRPIRRKLPAERHSITHKFSVAGTEGYITVGLYEDAKPGEVFITMQKAGSTLNGIMDAFAVSMSLNLQYGVPLEVIIKKMAHTRYEPAGMTENKEIPLVKSITDYIARWMALRFLDADTAKLYHNSDLVDLSYKSGSNSRILIPFINGKGHTEVKLTAGEINLNTAQPVTKVEQPVVMSIAKAEGVNHAGSAEISQPALTPSSSSMESLLKQQQTLAAKQTDSDAPMCTNCGSVTTRQGSCYYCTSCGETTGCS